MSQTKKFNDLLKEAPIRTTSASFQGLFDLELIVTSRAEMEQASMAATTETLDRATGKYEKRVDDAKLRAYLATRVAGFRGLSLKKAMTLCGRDLPAELQERAKDPLSCEPETVDTLLDLVVGLQVWLLGQMRTIAIDAARRDEASQEN